MSRLQRTSQRWGAQDPLRSARINQLLTDIDYLLEQGNMRGGVIETKGTQLSANDAITGWTSAGVATAIATNSERYAEGAASLQMGASGVGTATYEQTIGSVDTSTAKKFRVWIFIPQDAASYMTTFTIRVGSSNANYYYWTITPTTAQMGTWNEIILNNYTGGLTGTYDRTGTTGAPNLSATTYFACIIAASAAMTSGKFLLDESRWCPLAFDIGACAYFVGSNQGNYAGASAQGLTASATRYIQITTVGTLAVNAVLSTTAAMIATVICDANQITSITITSPDVIGGAIGSGGYVFTSVTSTPYSITASSGSQSYLCNYTGGDLTINLPTAVANTSLIVIKRIDNSWFTTKIVPNGSQTIDGKSFFLLSFSQDTATLVSDNANWKII